MTIKATYSNVQPSKLTTIIGNTVMVNGLGANSLMIDKATALEILADRDPLGQRDLKRNTHKLYTSRINDGTWNDGTPITLGFVTGQDAFHIINGQHRIQAVADAEKGIIADLLVKEFPNFDELKKYSTTNVDNNAARSIKDKFKIDAHDFSPEEDAVLEKLKAAVQFLLGGMVTGDGGLSQKTDYETLIKPGVRDWMKYAVEHSTMVRKNKTIKKRGLDAAVLAVGMITLRCDRTRASDFWRDVVAEKDNVRGIVNFLGKFDDERFTPAQAARLVAAAWNLYLQDEPAQTVASLKEAIEGDSINGLEWKLVEIRIDHTPYDGSKRFYYQPFKPTEDKANRVLWPESEWLWKDEAGQEVETEVAS